MRILGIAFFVAVMLFGFLHYFGKPTGLPPEVVKVLNPPAQPQEEKKMEAIPAQADQSTPQGKTDARGVTKKSMAASEATGTAHKSMAKANAPATSGKHGSSGRKATRGKHDWDGGLPKTLPHLPPSADQLAEKRRHDEEKARAAARRDVELANNNYFKIVQDLEEGR